MFEGLGRLKGWLGMGSEDETPRDGAFSSRAEWHAFIVAFAVGVFYVGGFPYTEIAVALVLLYSLGVPVHEYVRADGWGKKAFKELSKEPWYAGGGVVLPYLVSEGVNLL